MTHEEILKALFDETLIGNAPRVLELTEEGLETGLSPEDMLLRRSSRHWRRSAPGSSAATSSCPRC